MDSKSAYIEYAKKHLWEQGARRKTTLHRFFDFSESGQIASRKIFGAGLSHEIFIVRKGDIIRYQINRDWNNYKKNIADFLDNPKSINYARKHMMYDSKSFIYWLKKNCNKILLQKLSNTELAKLLLKRHAKHQLLLAWQWFGFVGKYSLENILLNTLKKYPVSKDVIKIIFAHKRPISIIEEELHLKKIAHMIQQKKFNQTSVKKMLTEHLKKFGHIVVYDETNVPMSLAFLHNRLKKHVLNKHLSDDIRKTYSQFKNNKNAFEKLLASYKFTENDLNLITFSDKYAHFMELRNQFRALAALYSKDLFKIIAKKLNLTIYELLCFTDYEISDALLGKIIITQQEAKNRNRFSAIIFNNSNHLILTGKVAEKIKNIITQKHIVSEIKGRSTTTGIVSGNVKIVIDIQDIKKVKKGDILVSSMTKPVLLLDMKKVAGIITDEGGMLCHAAIISRELNIPCIVGTKIATQVLRDGDIVKIDTNKGVVEILQKKEL